VERLYKLIWLFLAILPGQAFSEEFVLVTSALVEYENFSNLELRKVFLGYSLSKGEQTVQAVINTAQEDSYNRFLQMVVAMSANRYERQLLSQSFRQGSSRPEIFDDIASLKQSLINQPGAISFMWRRDIATSPDLHVIQVLWSSSD
jgi:hypothetical protein